MGSQIELDGPEVLQVGMPALRVAEVLDVVADGGDGDNSAQVHAVTDQLGLERPEEALDDSVVVGVE